MASGQASCIVSPTRAIAPEPDERQAGQYAGHTYPTLQLPAKLRPSQPGMLIGKALVPSAVSTGVNGGRDLGAQGMFLTALRQAVASVQEGVLAASENDLRLSGMATTLTVGIGIWPEAYLVHVGDSRAYLVRGGRLRRLTRDQTLAQGLVEAGVLTPEGAEASPLSHVLTSAVGSDQFSPTISSFTMRQGDRFLLCTDGLTKHVSDERIREQLFSHASSEAVCRALLDEALGGGGSDNITIVAACARRAE